MSNFAANIAASSIVYMLVDPIAMVPFYIGIGLPSRPLQHFREANRSSAQSHKVNRIRALRAKGVEDGAMVVVIAGGLSPNEARCSEEWLIAEWGRRSTRTGPLTNLTPGGERNPMDDPESRAKCAARIAERCYTEEQRQKMSETFRSRRCDTKFNSRMQLAAQSQEARAKRGKAISAAYQADPQRLEDFKASAAAVKKTEKWKAAHRDAMRALSQNPSWQAKQRIKTFSSDTKARMSVAASHRSDEHKRKLSIAAKARLADPVKREQMRLQGLERWANPEYRERVLSARRSPECKAKTDAAAQKRYSDPEKLRKAQDHMRRVQSLRWKREPV